MAGLSVRRFTAGDEAAWDDIIGCSRARHFFFRRGYMTYHADRFTDYSLLVHDGDRVVACLPANRDGDTIVSHGGLTFGGLIDDGSLGTRRMVEALGVVLDFLAGAGATSLVYKPVPHIYHVFPAEEDLYALFVHKAELFRRDVSSTLRPNGAPPMTKGRRSAIRQAERSGVTVADSDDFAGFMAIEAQALGDRHGVTPAHTGAELELLAGRFPDHIRLTAGFLGDRLVAGVVVYETETVAHAQYIGATEEGYDCHALDFILAHLIGERYRDKRFFDFGISTIEGGRVLNEGLIRNKESFGARATNHDFYRLRFV
jgi:Acetyltransferase (GNAT) domain